MYAIRSYYGHRWHEGLAHEAHVLDGIEGVGVEALDDRHDILESAPQRHSVALVLNEHAGTTACVSSEIS